MNRKWIIGPALVAALAVPAAVRAHEGHAHKVMGTVSTIDGNHVEVKTTDGKIVMLMLDAKTKIIQGKTKLDATALKVGIRVVAQGTESKGMVTATSIEVGTGSAPTSEK